MARFFCTIAFANATEITALHICGRPTYKTRISIKGWLFSWCVKRAED
jgi:hypothetical protein